MLVLTVLTLAAGPSLIRAGIQPAPSGPTNALRRRRRLPLWGLCVPSLQVNDSATARRTPSGTSPTVFTVQKGDNITALTGVVVTTSPGQVRFREPADLPWWEFEVVNVGGQTVRRPKASGVVHVEPGETLYLLTYRGEGRTKAWFKGRLVIVATAFPSGSPM